MSRATTTRLAPAARDETGKSDPECVGHLDVQLVGHGAANVVGLDDVGEV